MLHNFWKQVPIVYKILIQSVDGHNPQWIMSEEYYFLFKFRVTKQQVTYINLESFTSWLLQNKTKIKIFIWYFPISTYCSSCIRPCSAMTRLPWQSLRRWVWSVPSHITVTFSGSPVGDVTVHGCTRADRRFAHAQVCQLFFFFTGRWQACMISLIYMIVSGNKGGKCSLWGEYLHTDLLRQTS